MPATAWPAYRGLTPSALRDRFSEINRRITTREHDDAIAAARDAGLRRLDRPRRFPEVAGI